jgi:hypothetical protein
MTDKIRIVGAFGDNVVPSVQSFVATLEGVQTVSVLRDGAEQYPQQENGEQGEGEQAQTA